ncbi:MAG: manganese ABC transporter substrate-binding protein, partial [Lactococcus lactis]|nr:manganese ABC transporter substrate-binding protein [Lactococcus lactis]
IAVGSSIVITSAIIFAISFLVSPKQNFIKKKVKIDDKKI